MSKFDKPEGVSLHKVDLSDETAERSCPLSKPVDGFGRSNKSDHCDPVSQERQSNNSKQKHFTALPSIYTYYSSSIPS